jgi:hypothetical protein
MAAKDARSESSTNHRFNTPLHRPHDSCEGP